MTARFDMRTPLARISPLFGGARWMMAVIALALLSAAFLISQTPRPSDDAYITFRHIHNLVEQGRPVWNLQGPRVLGSTTPGYLFSLALFCWITGMRNIPLAALLLNALIQAGIVILVYLIARNVLDNAFRAWLAAALIAFNAILIYTSSQGFENPAFCFILLTAIWAMTCQAPVWTILLASLAPLFRPEGILLSLMVWPWLLINRQATWRRGLLYLAIPMLWFCFATSYYGSCIPHSILAKRHAAALFYPYTHETFDPIIQLLSLPVGIIANWRIWAAKALFNGATHEPWGCLARYIVGWIGTLLLVPAGIFALRRRGALLWVGIYAALVLAFFTFLGGLASWYYPSFVVFALLGLFMGITLGIDALFQTRHPKIAHALAILLCLVLFSANRYTYHRGLIPEPRPWVYARDPNKGDWSGMELERYLAYRDAALRLNDRLAEHPGAALTSEVGVFGYFFKGDVIDTGSLCSPEVLSYFPPASSDYLDAQGIPYSNANHTVPEALVNDLKPMYIMDSEVYLKGLTRPGGAIDRDYTRIETCPNAWGSPVYIYQRNN